MSNPIATFLFTATGAFAIWATKGFKGSFNNEMVSPDERNSIKGIKRFYLGLAIWVLIIAVTSVILTRPTETKVYKIIKTNEKGEIIELEEIK
jgi:hypothetical protein